MRRYPAEGVCECVALFVPGTAPLLSLLPGCGRRGEQEKKQRESESVLAHLPAQVAALPCLPTEELSSRS